MTSIPFIEKNRNWLRVYARTAWVVAVLMILVGGLDMAGTLVSATHQQSNAGRISLTMIGLSGGVLGVFQGLLVLLLAHFVSYVVSDRQNPGPVLRNAHLFLYGCAGLVLVHQGAAFVALFLWLGRPGLPTVQNMVLISFSQVIKTMVIFLVLFGLGYALRRLLPVIEESKSLV